jgi:alpha-tubulin suppressor-like RCC1 family protein
MPIRVSRRMFVTGGAMLGTGLLINQYEGVLQFARQFGVSALAAGYRFSLAVQNGEVLAWGDNTYGQIDVPRNLPRIQQVSAGERHALALSTSGEVFAWGGALGRNTLPFVTVPRMLPPIVRVLAATDYSFLLADDYQTLYILGEGANGRTFRVINWPKKIQHIQNYFGNYLAIIDEEGKVTVLDISNTTSEDLWQEIELLFRESVMQICLIDSLQVFLGLSSTGELHYWNGFRENRNGEVVTQNASQEEIDRAERVLAIRKLNEITNIISAPDYSGFYTLNRQGEIAYIGPELDGDKRAMAIPLPRSALVRQMARSRSHVLALTTDGEVVSWGFEDENDRGQYDIPRQLGS